MQRKPIFTKSTQLTLLSALAALSFSTAQAQWANFPNTTTGPNTRFTLTGNVGIGTAVGVTPAVKLQVEGGNIGQLSSGTFGAATGKWSALGEPPTAFPTGGTYYGLINNWAQQNFITGLLDNGTKKDGVIAWQDQTSTSTTAGTALRIGFIKGFGTSGTNPATFSEKMTILANGNVGFGTTNPLDRIGIEGNILFKASNTIGSGSISIERPSSGSGRALFLISGNAASGGGTGGTLDLRAGDGSGGRGGDVDIRSGSGDSGFPGGNINLNPGTGLAFGNVVINTAKLGIGTSSPVYRIELPNIANTSGQARANAWVTYSSGRWKDNVKTIGKATEKILALRGVEYDWKKENGGAHAIGFVAEEVGKVLPEAVSWEADGKSAMGMNYDAVIPVLVEAFKELVKEKDAKIKSLEERVASMEKASASGSRQVVGEGLSGNQISATLLQNRPNPFSATTAIEYVLPATVSKAALYVYDMQGKQLKSFDVSDQSKKSVEINGKELPAGMYLYSLVVDGEVVDTKRMLLTK